MRWFLGLLVMNIVSGIAAQPVATAELASTALIVRVYDSAGLSKTAMAMAFDAARDALAPASIEVTWVRCTASGPGRCAQPLARGEVMVRLVRLPGTNAAPTDEALGNALVDPVTGSGVLATVYVDRVEQLAASAKSDLGILLGRAMAHEIGHLLLGRSTHAVHGLMRPRWTRAEIVRNASADWGFALPDRLAIRTRRAF